MIRDESERLGPEMSDRETVYSGRIERSDWRD